MKREDKIIGTWEDYRDTMSDDRGVYKLIEEMTR